MLFARHNNSSGSGSPDRSGQGASMKMVKLILWAACVVSAVSSAAQPHWTRFDPRHDGFHFVNTFQNLVQLPAGVNIRTGGLCGGMTYAALDHYLAGKPIPQQDYLPAEGTPLQRYLYDRQMTSLVSNVDKWAEISLNPLGARDSEFFNWGLQGTGGGRLQELRSYLDRGVPVPLGLKADHGGDHQVLAIGYDMGRYRGDLGANEGDFKIFLYDPNHPNRYMTLVPDLAAKVYRYPAGDNDGDNDTWRTYFVDRNYHAQVPPNLTTPTYPNDGLVHELLMTFVTGTDDLRGGGDDVSMTVSLMDGSQQAYRSINGGKRWMSNTTMTARVVLTRPVPAAQIHTVLISTNFGGGVGGDNWDMMSVEVKAVLGGGTSSVIGGSTRYHRFTGNDKQVLLNINTPPAVSGQVTRLKLEVRTGGDDLRGGHDNLNVQVNFADGRTQMSANVNNGAHWANNTTNYIDILLDRPVPVSQIRSLTLITTFTGGMGGDNWNMDSLKVTATGQGVNQVIGTHGYNRFTGDRRQLEVPLH
jgi:hypothetical protein